MALNETMSEPTDPNQPASRRKTPRAFAEKTVSGVQQRPVKSVVWAFFIGIFLTVFPLGRIVGAMISLAIALLRPALLVLGAVKLFEEVEHRRK